jgi:transcriptional regulator with XRE-family HTH domain
MSVMKDITLRNSEQLGRSIRLKRLEKGLSQKTLAERLGVERKWVIHLEAGNSRAEFGLVLKTLEVLNLHASLSDEDQSASGKAVRPNPSRLDEVFRRLERSARK